jgi:hypothetical protein
MRRLSAATLVVLVAVALVRPVSAQSRIFGFQQQKT